MRPLHGECPANAKNFVDFVDNFQQKLQFARRCVRKRSCNTVTKNTQDFRRKFIIPLNAPPQFQISEFEYAANDRLRNGAHDLLPSRRNKSTEQFARRRNATAQSGNISHYRACSVSAVNANAWHDQEQTIGTEYPPVPRDHRKHHINATLRRGDRDRQAGSKMPQSTGSLPLYAAYTHDPRQDKSAQTANDTVRVPWRSATSDDRTCAVVVSIAQTPNFAAPCISAFTAALKEFTFDRHAL